MRNIEQISDHKVLAYDKGNMLSYHRGKLFIENDCQRSFICNIPQSRKMALLSRFRITERLLRLEPRVACSLGNDLFLLSCSGWIYQVNAKTKTIIPELRLRERMNNPLSFTKVEGANRDDCSVLFGEYFSNNNSEKVCIFERQKGCWEEVYSFEPGQIYHIHGIVRGFEPNTFYVLTGDSDSESGIWMTTNHFKTMHRIVGGSQQYRSCVAFPYQNGLLYATDTPREKNHIYYLFNRNGEWETKCISQIPGPCIYGAKRNELFLFSTSVEADDTLPTWRYRFSRKLGVGVEDYYSHVISVNNKGEITEESKFKKDRLPMLLFQFGNCLFPEASESSPIICTPISVDRFDGKTVCLKEVDE